MGAKESHLPYYDDWQGVEVRQSFCLTTCHEFPGTDGGESAISCTGINNCAFLDAEFARAEISFVEKCFSEPPDEAFGFREAPPKIAAKYWKLGGYNEGCGGYNMNEKCWMIGRGMAGNDANDQYMRPLRDLTPEGNDDYDTTDWHWGVRNFSHHQAGWAGGADEQNARLSFATYETGYGTAIRSVDGRWLRATANGKLLFNVVGTLNPEYSGVPFPVPYTDEEERECAFKIHTSFGVGVLGTRQKFAMGWHFEYMGLYEYEAGKSVMPGEPFESEGPEEMQSVVEDLLARCEAAEKPYPWTNQGGFVSFGYTEDIQSGYTSVGLSPDPTWNQGKKIRNRDGEEGILLDEPVDIKAPDGTVIGTIGYIGGQGSFTRGLSDIRYYQSAIYRLNKVEENGNARVRRLRKALEEETKLHLAAEKEAASGKVLRSEVVSGRLVGEAMTEPTDIAAAVAVDEDNLIILAAIERNYHDTGDDIKMLGINRLRASVSERVNSAPDEMDPESIYACWVEHDKMCFCFESKGKLRVSNFLLGQAEVDADDAEARAEMEAVLEEEKSERLDRFNPSQKFGLPEHARMTGSGMSKDYVFLKKVVMAPDDLWIYAAVDGGFMKMVGHEAERGKQHQGQKIGERAHPYEGNSAKVSPLEVFLAWENAQTFNCNGDCPGTYNLDLSGSEPPDVAEKNRIREEKRQQEQEEDRAEAEENARRMAEEQDSEGEREIPDLGNMPGYKNTKWNYEYGNGQVNAENENPRVVSGDEELKIYSDGYIWPARAHCVLELQKEWFATFPRAGGSMLLDEDKWCAGNGRSYVICFAGDMGDGGGRRSKFKIMLALLDCTGTKVKNTQDVHNKDNMPDKGKMKKMRADIGVTLLKKAVPGDLLAVLIVGAPWPGYETHCSKSRIVLAFHREAPPTPPPEAAPPEPVTVEVDSRVEEEPLDPEAGLPEAGPEGSCTCLSRLDLTRFDRLDLTGQTKQTRFDRACHYHGHYLSGHASDGGEVHQSLEAACAACLSDPTAGGVTKEGNTGYTVRAGTELIAVSGTGEISWLKSDFEIPEPAPAPEPEPAPAVVSSSSCCVVS